MSFAWVHYLNLAKILDKHADDFASGTKVVLSSEASYRTAVSRAYYSAFCISRAYVEQVAGPLGRSSDVHKKVSNYFMDQQGDNYRQIGINLNRLRDNRNKADYDLPLAGCKSLSRASVKIATDIIAKVERLP